jgi:predicted dehydrogenase
VSPRAVIVGLGRVGSRFDEEPGRRAVWSHAGAYLAVAGRLRLAAAVEVEPGNVGAFRRRCPDVPIAATIAEACGTDGVEIVSICTPAETHRRILEEALAVPGVRVVWCEKPLALSLADAEAMVEACRRHGVRLVVSHVRRWHPLWQRLREAAASGEVGTVRSIRIAMPNRLWTIGSHALDLLTMLGGEVRGWRGLDIAALAEEGEPARAALVDFAGGWYGILQITGRKANLVVEAEIICEDGRMLAREAAGEIEFERFVDSDQYSGYRQLQPIRTEMVGSLADHSPFVAIAEEISALLDDPARQPSCSGDDALAVQRLLDGLGTTPLH